MIRCLSKDVQCKLRSGVAICSLQQCVEEIILNSVDAGATCVGVRVDMEAFKVQVIDNGSGMGIEDMEKVGNRYFTSKCTTLEDLDNLRFYGFRGEAVASIVSLAMLVEISSRTKLSVKTHVKVFKDGKGLDVFEGKTTRPSAGTTVTICNFFHNMPVRRKRMDAVLESDRMRQRVEAVSLMHPSVSFTLKNDCTGAMVVQLSKAQNTYYRFVQIHGLGKAQRLGPIGHSHAQFEVIGYIGREGHYNNNLQFLYVNDRLLLKTRIHKMLNFLLRKVSSSYQKNTSPDASSSFRSPKQKRGAELHGVYVMNIKCHYSEYDICLEPAKTLIEFKDWDGIMFCVEEAVRTFMTREKLLVELSPGDIEYAGQNLFSGHTGDAGVERADDTRAREALTQGISLECNIEGTLTSEAVHRSMKKDFDVLSHACVEDPVQGDQRDNCRENSDPSVECLETDIETTPSVTHSRMTAVTDLSESVPPGDRKEMQLNTLLNVGDESHNTGASIVHDWPDVEHLKTIKEKSAEIQSHLSVSKSIDGALSMAIQEQSCSKQIPQKQQKIRLQDLTKVSNAKTHLLNSLLHGNGSQKCTVDHLRPGLVMRCQENLATKRHLSPIEDLGNGKASQREYREHPAIASKIPRVFSGQKLTLSKEAGSLDKFRRIYGKRSEFKSLPVDTKSNLSAADAIASQKSGVPEKHEADKQEVKLRAVMESQLDGENDHRSPLTLSMFTKLKPLSAQCKSGGTSLAAKLSNLKNKPRSEVRGVSLTYLSEALSNVDTVPEDTLTNTTVENVNNNCDTVNSGEQACLNPDDIPESSSSPPSAKKEVAESSDWLHHYDDSTGKVVYVNTVTGLSRYGEPSGEESQTTCTSDVTNMAISVVSNKGIEAPTSNSLSSLYSEWTNPVFERPPMVAVDVSAGQAEGLVVKVHNILFPYRFSKDMIHSMKVINQVDKKFLACLIDTRGPECENSRKDGVSGNLLVLVDQHAAHERVRLEDLIEDSHEDDPEALGERRLASFNIAPPLEVTVTEEEVRLLRSCEPHLRNLGLEMQFSLGGLRALVSKVPMCFTEKENNEVRRGRPSIIKSIVEEYLREQIELLRLTGRVRGSLPLTVLKVLASLACHGAIKFNDSLNKNECCSLVACLSSCKLPFQCAHGRPSIAPLVDIFHLSDQQEPKPNLWKLRRMYKSWKLYGTS
ncbi:DNA mismatch repair protein Mlh3 isoform X2 [Hypomesus transpacificus]|uniref:DNA mismatch repair protein Mlh3 isoform X2 n=1 Tax=Hypomesus transpacificus TaxID=137520 RepID=UPI001F0879F9|nr:DNA mismatch repair protein Mlh3 isoform X2 [Hypomesus transpacificus]